MTDITATPESEAPKPARKTRATKVAAAVDAAIDTVNEQSGAAKTKFAKALEDAKTGAQSLGKQAQDAAGVYKEKLAGKSDALIEDAKALGEQAKEKAATLAQDGKGKVVEGISGLSKVVADNAGMIDEKLGVKYGDYARSAAKTFEDAAAKLEAKDLTELGDDAREAIRKSPALAVGIAAAAGFLVSRLFKGSNSDSSD